MSQALIEALITKHGFVRCDGRNRGCLSQREPGKRAVLHGDPERLVEVADVAVILPEILTEFKGRLTPALVEKSAERGLQRRYRFNAFPALVFLRGGEYLGAICRVLDWQDYLMEVQSILAREPSVPPAYEFPEGCIPSAGANGAGHDHDRTGDYQ